MPKVIQADRTGYQKFALAIYLVCVAVVLAACLSQSDGRFIYPLDDPYIHLSVAETILRGGYGVNFPEYSSPSSSILFPWLLAAGLAVGLGVYGPLVLGIVSGAVSVWIMAGFVWSHTVQAGSPQSAGVAYIAGVLVIFASNSIGLAVIGMEHSLHVLCTVLTLVGLTRLRPGAAVPLILLAGVFFAPLIRFEAAALSAFGIAALLWQGHRTAALGVTVALASVVAAYGIYMQSIGLSVLPSSVLSKSGVSAAVFDSGGSGVMAEVFEGVKRSAATQWGPIFAAAIGLAIFSIFRGSKQDYRQKRLVAGAIIVTLSAHILFGKYGWLSRYEVYAVVLMFLGLAYLFSEQISTATAQSRIQGYSLLVVMTVFALGYLVTTIITPKASKNVYVQQYQMHRFTTEMFDHPVAVNDLGWVSFRNDTYVLDLWGLGSETARRLIRSAGMTPQAVGALVDAKGVKYAMLYESWFNYDLPVKWCRVAVLETEMVTAGDSRTSVFLIDPLLADDMAVALQTFEASLPLGAAFHRSECSDRERRGG